MLPLGMSRVVPDGRWFRSRRKKGFFPFHHPLSPHHLILEDASCGPRRKVSDFLRPFIACPEAADGHVVLTFLEWNRLLDPLDS